MKKLILLLTTLSPLISTPEAKSNSWTGIHLKLSPAYSKLNLNYSGDTPLTMKLETKHSFNNYYNNYSGGYSTHTIAEKVSKDTLTVDFSVGGGMEVSSSFGIMGELGSTIGRTSNFIDSNDAIISNIFLTAGLFYHHPSFRIYGMGGFGIGEDIFGYPNAVEHLTGSSGASIKGNKSLANSTIGLTYRTTFGLDYKIDMILLGISYAYTRSITNVTLENNETFYISNHAIAAMVGVHL